MKLSRSLFHGHDCQRGLPDAPRKVAWSGSILRGPLSQYQQVLPLTCSQFSGALFQPCAWRETAWLPALGGRGTMPPHALVSPPSPPAFYVCLLPVSRDSLLSGLQRRSLQSWARGLQGQPPHPPCVGPQLALLTRHPPPSPPTSKGGCCHS